MRVRAACTPLQGFDRLAARRRTPFRSLRTYEQRPLHADSKLRSQLDDAADSVCRNIAEGFGCGNVEFARFLRIARRSLNEVQDELHSAVLKAHLTEADLVSARKLMAGCTPRFRR
jgi:four helix bundle protein